MTHPFIQSPAMNSALSQPGAPTTPLSRLDFFSMPECTFTYKNGKHLMDFSELSLFVFCSGKIPAIPAHRPSQLRNVTHIHGDSWEEDCNTWAGRRNIGDVNRNANPFLQSIASRHLPSTVC